MVVNMNNFHVQVFKDENGNDKTVKVICKEWGRVPISATATCDPKDQFSFEPGLTICLCKLFLGRHNYYKIVKNLTKKYKDELEKKNQEEQEKAIIERRKKKAIAKKKRRAERRREEQIEIQKEAYKRAMQELESKQEGTKHAE